MVLSLNKWFICTFATTKTADANNKLVAVGENSKHLSGYDLNPVLFYYSYLQGWSLTADKWKQSYIEELREEGATHLVFVLSYGYPFNFIYLPEVPVEPFIQEK